MCAINGFTWEDREQLVAMNRAISHRGPDGTGNYVTPEVSLGHNRLAIIDLSPQAACPMKSFDGKHVIIFNGEIYNFRELKAELRDYPYETNGDTEVILAAYRRWGTDAFRRLNGMFAFALWDSDRRELLVVRDHVGIKPLYYALTKKGLIFSSEIKAILTHPSIGRVLDQDAFSHYMRLLYTPEPLTPFQGIKKLPPASFISYREGRFAITEFWNAKRTHTTETKYELGEKLLHLIDQAVTRQLVSDRPLGVYLSGGLDSTAVLDGMSRQRHAIDTFSVGFELEAGEQAEKFNADLNLARRTAAHYGTKHHEVKLAASEVPDLLEKGIYHLDEPVSNPTLIAQMKLADFTRKKVVVALSGDGGDELFGGYPRYRLSVLSGMYRWIPAPLRLPLRAYGTLRKLDTAPDLRRFAQFMFQKNVSLKRILNNVPDWKATAVHFEERYPSAKNYETFEDWFMDIDRRSWLVDESLLRSDKTAMSVGLEQRVPLLDVDLIAFAAGLPRSLKVNARETKILYREALKSRLPGYLFTEPKRGWFSPASKWLRREDITTFVREVLSPTYYQETASLFNFSGIERMLEEHLSGKGYHLIPLWSILTFQLWARRFNITV